MPDGQDDGLFAVEPVRDHIAAGAEVDWPFAKLAVHAYDGPPDLRLPRKDLDPAADSFYGSAGCVGVLGDQESA